MSVSWRSFGYYSVLSSGIPNWAQVVVDPGPGEMNPWHESLLELLQFSTGDGVYNSSPRQYRPRANLYHAYDNSIHVELFAHIPPGSRSVTQLFDLHPLSDGPVEVWFLFTNTPTLPNVESGSVLSERTRSHQGASYPHFAFHFPLTSCHAYFIGNSSNIHQTFRDLSSSWVSVSTS